MAYAFVFPGQGSQEVGMGVALAEHFAVARAVFDEVDDALGQNLAALMRDGPQAELTLTQNAQPALMAVSVAVVRVLESEFGVAVKDHAKFVAGHSLGEYSALAAAGTFSLSDAAKILRTRGLAMQSAVPVGEGAMVALLGVGIDVAQKVAEAAARDGEGEVCQIANDNEPTQVVLSGSKAAIDRVQEIGRAHGVRRAVPLPVSAPFHCVLMQPAAEIMKAALDDVVMRAPVVPLISNVTAGPLIDPEEIKRNLVLQVTGTVRWRESVLAMSGAGVTDFYELGCGKVLSGLARRIEKSVTATPVGVPDELRAAADVLKA